jgi:hypothetical protein
VGFPETKEKILAVAHDPYSVGIRRHYVLCRRLSYRAVYLFALLKPIRIQGTTPKVLG